MPSLRDPGCTCGEIQAKIGRIVLLFAMVLVPEVPRHILRFKEPRERGTAPKADKILAETGSWAS